MSGSVIVYFSYCILYLCLVLFCIWHLLFVKNIWLLTLFVRSVPSSLSIFMIITLTSLSDRWHIPTSLCSSSRVLSYSFVWNIFLCHLIRYFYFYVFGRVATFSSSFRYSKGDTLTNGDFHYQCIINIFLQRGNSYLIFRVFPSLLYLKNNQLKWYSKQLHFGVANSAPLTL